jgi:hypothetical protein
MLATIGRQRVRLHARKETHMFGLTTSDYQKRKMRKRTKRVTRKRVVLALALFFVIGATTESANAPTSGRVFEDCSIGATQHATQAQADAFASFNAIPDPERFAICELIAPDFLTRFD